MAYRDQPVDPRIRELEALIAAEPALRTQLVPLRMANDEAMSRADVIGPRLSELSAELAKRETVSDEALAAKLAKEGGS